MQPLAEASVAKVVPTKSSIIRPVEPDTRAASNSGVPAWPRYSQGIRPEQTYQVRVAAISSVMMPAIVPYGCERAGERTSCFAFRPASAGA